MEQAATPTPVPLSGFLNLSAVSWQPRVSRPCFMPQPFLGFSLQSLPLAGIAHPSRGHMLPCGHPPACLTTPPGPCHRRFPRRPRFHAVAWFPRRLWAPFSRAEARFPVAPGPSDGTRPFRQLHPLRSLDPPARPHAPTRVAPCQRAVPLLGFCLSRAFSSCASGSPPARTARARACPIARRLRRTTRRTLTPREPGEAVPTLNALKQPRRRLPAP
jgi:hypothetical protein